MARIDTLEHYLTDVADAIRTKTGTSGTIQASAFDTEISNIPSGGSGLDWSAIGYSAEPEAIQMGYDYAVEVKNNWNTQTSLISRFYNDWKLVFMPLVTTTSKTNMEAMFNGCYSLISIPLLDTSSVTKFKQTFKECRSLKSIPLLDTSSATTMQNMFSNCYSLRYIPLLDTSSINSNTGFANMFVNCGLLTDECLNNILKMCSNAVNYQGQKRLSDLGISVNTTYSIDRIESLSNYQDFINAGWVIQD